MIEIRIDNDWIEIKGARYSRVSFDEYMVSIPTRWMTEINSLNSAQLRIDGRLSQQVIAESSGLSIVDHISNGQIQIKVLF
jgi:hypothetical protein